MTKPVTIGTLSIGSGMPKICVPLTAKTREELIEESLAASAVEPDLLEWRADCFDEPLTRENIQEILYLIAHEAGDIPVIFTIRTEEEGGKWKRSSGNYEELLLEAAMSGEADLIDVEALRDPDNMKELIEKIHECGVLAVSSSHDFEKTGSGELLLQKLRALEASGGDILKLAVMPEDDSDVRILMNTVKLFTSEKSEKPVIAMSMGEQGVISRIEGERYGSCVTFGTAGAASAPGQLPVMKLKTMMEERKNFQ